MQLPTASCPKCKTTVLVYGDVSPEADPREARIRWRCVDCETLLDRFGATVDVTNAPLSELMSAGYQDLDRGKPVGPGGCFENNNCDGCPKIDTRPW